MCESSIAKLSQNTVHSPAFRETELLLEHGSSQHYAGGSSEAFPRFPLAASIQNQLLQGSDRQTARLETAPGVL